MKESAKKVTLGGKGRSGSRTCMDCPAECASCNSRRRTDKRLGCGNKEETEMTRKTGIIRVAVESVYLSETEAAAYLRISTYTLRRWRRRGYADRNGTPPPEHCLVGRQIRYRWDELVDWLEKWTLRRRRTPSRRKGCRKENRRVSRKAVLRR